MRSTAGGQLPLHPFRMINFRSCTLFFIPYPYCAIPTSTDEFHTGRTPVTAHHCGNMCLIDLGWGGELSDVECVEVVVF
jgi:hypothetical protein